MTYLIKIQSMNEYIGAVLLSHSLPGQLQVCGPAKPGNHCLKFPNFGFLKFHVHYQLWFLYVFVFVSKIDICHMYRSQTLLWHVWGRYWFENRSLDFGFGSQHSWEKTSSKMILYFLCLKMFLYQKVAKSTWQVDVPRSGNRQSRSTVLRLRPLPAILMVAQNKMIGGQTIEGKSKTGFKPIWFPLSKLWQVGKRAAFLSQHNDVQLGYQVKRSLSWWKKTASF